MANVTMTFDAETAKLVSGFMQVENKQKSLEDRQRRLAASTRGQHNDAASGLSRWAGQFGSVIAGYLSLGAAIGVATKALNDMRAEREKAASSAKESAPAMGMLAQLSGGDVEAQKKLIARARGMTKHGMGQSQGAGLVFALESMGLGGGKFDETFGGLHGITQNPAALAEGVSTLQNALGATETGAPANVLNKLFAASAVSKTTVEQFAPAASTAAKAIKGIGGSDEEFLAAIAEMSKSTKSADVAATQIDAFASATIKMGMKGEGLMSRAEQIAKRGFSDQKLLALFGRKEAFRGFKALMDQRDDIQRTTAELRKVDRETGTQGDLVTKMQAAYIGADPALAAERQARIAKEKLAVTATEKLAPQELTNQSLIAREEARSIREGEDAFPRWQARLGMSIRSTIGLRPVNDMTMPSFVRRIEESEAKAGVLSGRPSYLPTIEEVPMAGTAGAAGRPSTLPTIGEVPMTGGGVGLAARGEAKSSPAAGASPYKFTDQGEAPSGPAGAYGAPGPRAGGPAPMAIPGMEFAGMDAAPMKVVVVDDRSRGARPNRNAGTE